MSKIESLPVVCYIVRNMNTGKEYEYNNLDEAIKSLNESRKYNEDATWKLFAEIDA